MWCWCWRQVAVLADQDEGIKFVELWILLLCTLCRVVVHRTQHGFTHNSCKTWGGRRLFLKPFACLAYLAQFGLCFQTSLFVFVCAAGSIDLTSDSADGLSPSRKRIRTVCKCGAVCCRGYLNWVWVYNITNTLFSSKSVLRRLFFHTYIILTANVNEYNEKKVFCL